MAIKIGDKVKVKAHDYRINNRIGVVTDIVKFKKIGKPTCFTKYYVDFFDRKFKISDGEFTRDELVKAR